MAAHFDSGCGQRTSTMEDGDSGCGQRTSTMEDGDSGCGQRTSTTEDGGAPRRRTTAALNRWGFTLKLLNGTLAYLASQLNRTRVIAYGAFVWAVTTFLVAFSSTFFQISFAAKEVDLAEWKGDILAIGVTAKDLVKDEKSKFKNAILQKLDTKLGGLLSEISSEEDFTGKAGQSFMIINLL